MLWFCRRICVTRLRLVNTTTIVLQKSKLFISVYKLLLYTELYTKWIRTNLKTYVQKKSTCTTFTAMTKTKNWEKFHVSFEFHTRISVNDQLVIVIVKKSLIYVKISVRKRHFVTHSANSMWCTFAYYIQRQ